MAQCRDSDRNKYSKEHFASTINYYNWILMLSICNLGGLIDYVVIYSSDVLGTTPSSSSCHLPSSTSSHSLSVNCVCCTYIWLAPRRLTLVLSWWSIVQHALELFLCLLRLRLCGPSLASWEPASLHSSACLVNNNNSSNSGRATTSNNKEPERNGMDGASLV